MSALHRQLPDFAFAGANKHPASHTKPPRESSKPSRAEAPQPPLQAPPQVESEQDAVPGYN
ncbi:MAG: hypothetical protein KDG52_05400 [Rhodocyclaceae bacterium]|nr:hypothetical protein [Rhodocyclaceae bacterium]